MGKEPVTEGGRARGRRDGIGQQKRVDKMAAPLVTRGPERKEARTEKKSISCRRAGTEEWGNGRRENRRERNAQ